MKYRASTISVSEKGHGSNSIRNSRGLLGCAVGSIIRMHYIGCCSEGFESRQKGVLGRMFSICP